MLEIFLPNHFFALLLRGSACQRLDLEDDASDVGGFIGSQSIAKFLEWRGCFRRADLASRAASGGRERECG